MFDLKQQLRGWRERMMQSEACKTEDLDELESHLCDGIKPLRNKGLTEEEAFWISAHRLGSGERLGEEFAKINSGMLWKKRIFWMVGGYFLLNLLLLLTEFAQSAYLLRFKWGTLRTPLLGPDFPVPVIPGASAILLVGLLYFGLTRKSWKFERWLKPVHRDRSWKIFWMILLFVTLVLTVVGRQVFMALFVRVSNIETVGRISGAAAILDLSLKLFLALFFTRIAGQFPSRRREEAARPD